MYDIGSIISQLKKKKVPLIIKANWPIIILEPKTINAYALLSAFLSNFNFKALSLISIFYLSSIIFSNSDTFNRLTESLKDLK